MIIDIIKYTLVWKDMAPLERLPCIFAWQCPLPTPTLARPQPNKNALNMVHQISMTMSNTWNFKGKNLLHYESWDPPFDLRLTPFRHMSVISKPLGFANTPRTTY